MLAHPLIAFDIETVPDPDFDRQRAGWKKVKTVEL